MGTTSSSKPFCQQRQMLHCRRRSKHCPRGLTTRAQVHGGVTQTFRRNNLAEHLLAEARAEFHCSAEKQTRHGLWRQYVEKIEALCTEEEDGTTPGAMQPVKFRLHIWCVFFV